MTARCPKPCSPRPAGSGGCWSYGTRSRSVAPARVSPEARSRRRSSHGQRSHRQQRGRETGLRLQGGSDEFHRYRPGVLRHLDIRNGGGAGFPEAVLFVGRSVCSDVGSLRHLCRGLRGAARPFGSVIFGHIGDRIGRKNALVATLIVMGVATIGIGCLPTYEAVGVLAPTLLLLLRMVQSMAFGGEWGGAVLIAYEHAPPGRRCFFASLPQTGLPMGVVLGNAVFLAVASLPSNQFVAWGWRIPFLLSFVLVIFGIIVRLKISETPEFEEEVKERGAQARVPLVEAFRVHWRQVILTGGAFLGFGLFATVSIVYLISYATEQVGVSRSAILTIVLITTALQLIVFPLGGVLADRFGVRRIVLTGVIGSAIGVFVQSVLVDTGQFGWILAGYVLAFGFFASIGYGAFAALFAAAFSARTRYSGLSLGNTLATVIGAGMGPFVATVLMQATGTIVSVAGYVAVVLVISGVCLTILMRQVTVGARPAPPREETAAAPAEPAEP
ncbi:MAG: MFS transporter [Streptosporangiales bacterium]|nr:MFS transporter [Streptosporangiales bacterium]